MKKVALGFTVVEIVIMIAVLAVLFTIMVVSYGTITEHSRRAAALSDLKQLATAMQSELQQTNAYPDTVPSGVTASDHVVLAVEKAGVQPYYSNLTPVQNGVLLADICDELLAEGVGKGHNAGGEEEDYLTGCGNWNDDSMQFTGWETKKWGTPVEKQPLLDYANAFTAKTSYNVDQERAVREFYGTLIDRFEQRGGTFPITSFWDYWATASNGGVMKQTLDTASSVKKPYFCAEAYVSDIPEEIWHITQEPGIKQGAC